MEQPTAVPALRVGKRKMRLLRLLILLICIKSVSAKDGSRIQISGQGFDLEPVSRILSIEPTRFEIDSVTEKKGREPRAFVSFWGYTPTESGDDFWEQKKYWINFIMQNEEALKKVLALEPSPINNLELKGPVEITIIFNSRVFSLSPEDMKIFSKHNIHIRHLKADTN